MADNHSRRSFLSVTAASLAWMFSGSRAHAAAPAIAAGSPCKSAGRERTVNGVTFACRNVNGKLVWRRKKFATVDQVVTVRVLESSALLVGATKIVEVPTAPGGTTGIAVTRTDSGITALRVNCTHQGFPVSRVEKVLECELHGSQFDPATGTVITGPASRPLLRYDATESDGGIYVTVRPT